MDCERERESRNFVLSERLDDDDDIYIYIVSWRAIVEGEPKIPFSIAIIPKCSGERYIFLWIALLTLDPYLIMLSVNARKHQVPCFLFFGMT